MNPGPVEEAGQTARSLIDALKAEPLSLALAVMNVALLAVFWFILSTLATSNRAREIQLFEQQRHTAELLSRCVVPERK